MLALFPEAKTCISVVCRMNPTNVQSPFRQQDQAEYHHMYDEVDQVARRAEARLSECGIRAMYVGSSYPMNFEHWPDTDMWRVSTQAHRDCRGNPPDGPPSPGLPRAVWEFHRAGHDSAGAGSDVTPDPSTRTPAASACCVSPCARWAPSMPTVMDNAIASTPTATGSRYGGFVDRVESLVEAGRSRDYRKGSFSDQETSSSSGRACRSDRASKCTDCMAGVPRRDDRIGPYV